MNIHQVTDLHIPDDPSDERFAHVRPNVLRQFEFVAAESPDLLVISGDLTMKDGSRTGCEWLAANLPEVPVIVIPGNHDDPALVRRIFGDWPATLPHDDCLLTFLDTSTDHLPDDQAAILAALESRHPTLLFLHHPPHLIGSGFMSTNQPLLNHAEAAAAIGSSPVTHAFCGHYHNQAHINCDGFELYLTPSPAFQIDLNSVPFQMEDFEPMVRTINVESGRVTTDLIPV